MNKKNMRAIPDLYDLLSERKRRFGTSLPREQKNLLIIMKDIETTIGIDMKSIPVVDNKPMIIPKKKLVRI